MGAIKWIGGAVGWVYGGPIGALIGIFLGSLFEKGIGSPLLTGGGQPDQNKRSDGTGRSSVYSASEQRNSFMVSLLVLSSAVIRADGRIDRSELDMVESFIRRNFGEPAVGEAMKILGELNGKEINIYSVGSQIASNMNYSQRLQLFHYLAQLGAVDGNFCVKEKDVLEAVAAAIRINPGDTASVIAMFFKGDDSAYSVLGITSSASDDEVKAAFRRMAMKNHPDKVATLGPDVQKAAEDKFRKIQEAYDTIKKQRGIK